MSTLKFKSVTNYGDYTISTILRDSLKYYLEWCFLEIGAFQNVAVSSSGGYGADNSKLYPVRSTSTNITDGKIWQSNRQNWVYESGISYGTHPISISGIYVNNTFQPATGVGPYKFSVDYVRGNIIFDSPIATSSIVKCGYTYKRIKFTDVDDNDYKKIQTYSLQNNNSNFTIGSGNNVELPETRLQLPLVAIQPVPRRTYPKGLGLGGGTYLEQDILFHIYADNSVECDKIFDIITNQHNGPVNLININKLATNNAYPINIQGKINNQLTTNYNNLVGESSQYGFGACVIKEMYGQEKYTYNDRFFGASIRATIEIPMGDV